MAVIEGYHDAHLTPHASRTVVWRVVAEHLERYVPENAAVLEIGAGYCAWINHVRARRRVALDLWPELPRFAGAGVEPVVADASTALSTLGAASFDVVLASNVLEHFDPDGAATVAGDVFALLRPGGHFIVVQPNFARCATKYFDDYTHRSIFTHVSLPAMLRSRGFTVERVASRFLPYSMRQARFPITGWLVRAYLHSPIKPLGGQMLVVARKR